MGIEYDVELLRSQLERAAETAERIAAAPDSDDMYITRARYWAEFVSSQMQISLAFAAERVKP